MEEDSLHRRITPSTASAAASSVSSSSSILQSLSLHVSFDHGYYLLVKAIQELREKKKGRVVTVGIGGPSGSGKTSLAEKVASVLGCVIISMDNYRTGVDDGNDLDSVDFEALAKNLQELVNGRDTLTPVFDFGEKRRIDSHSVKISPCRVVIVDGAYALHSVLRSLLDIRVAVVGGVHFSLLSKVQHDIGDSCSLDFLIDSIFPLFRKHIEPDLHHAQIRINNSFVSSFREAYYKLKCKSESPAGHPIFSSFGNDVRTENFIEMYLRPPFALEEAVINDWIKVRQSGIKYYLSLGDQRIVDKNFIIRPKAEFEVGRTTLGGLLALGYNVVVSFKRAATTVYCGRLLLVLENVDVLDDTFLVLKGTSRKIVGEEAASLGIMGPWITKSYLEMILESKGVPRVNTPPPLTNPISTDIQEKVLPRPRPISLSRSLSHKMEDQEQPWTRSPTKSDAEPNAPKWQFISSDPSQGSMLLAPMRDSYGLDRGLLLSVQGVQALLATQGFPVIVGIGGPSGSGKTSLAHKMANIIGCEVISLENYYKSENVKGFKYDDFSSLDLPLLFKNIDDIRHCRKTKIPRFDFEKCSRTGFKEIEISEDCGVVIFEGVYALHPDIRKLIDLWIAVVGGVHSHLISRVQNDKRNAGFLVSQNEIMATVFPIFQQHIEPHLVHAHLKIRNDFDPVLSPESSLFVLKSSTQVALQDILKVLDSGKVCSSVQNFTDIYLKLPGLRLSGKLTENDCIRVRICEGRFALLIREPIREGNFIVQPKVDFDISISTVAGLLKIGYQPVACIEASALIYQDGKVLVEVDHLEATSVHYLQIKGIDKDVVAAAASSLNLDGSYTAKTYLEIILESLPPHERNYSGIQNRQAARLQEIVDFILSQAGNSGSESPGSDEATSVVNGSLEDIHLKIKNLERWQTINMLLWTILMSTVIGYSLYKRKQH
ncbi:P-loop containing nucleoside triphosphate hydrolases superfamily protein isoform X2 [Wolffia australiana]